MSKEFVHLHVHTEYSLLDGACKIKELVKRTAELGQSAIAITDHGVMYGCIDFYKECIQQGIKPIIGCEVYVAPRSRLDKSGKSDMSAYHLVLLCKNNQGYVNLVKLISDAHINGFYNRPRCDKETLSKYSGGLIALSGCISGEVPKKLLTGEYLSALETAKEYQSIFGSGNFFLELQNHGLREELEILPLLKKIANEAGIPLAATNDAHYINKDDAEMQRVLMAISTNSVVEKGFGFKTDEFYLKSAAEMEELFSRDEISNTALIADKCNVEFEFGITRLPYFIRKDSGGSSSEKSAVTDNGSYFKHCILDGIKERYGENPADNIVERANYEISIIEKMGFVDYFLIVADFVRFAREKNIPVGPGRGSGVGSICAYALKITSVDPIRFNLLFERFLNPERISMPDFDIDFCYQRRGEVIEYVVRKYGSDHVAQIVTFGTMAARSAIRDSARTMGLPYNKADKIAKLIPFSMHPSLKKSLEHEKPLKELYQSDSATEKLIDTALKIEGMPRHVSVHAAGIVITRTPITDYLPLQKSGEDIITQYSMGNLEQLGLLKMDFLGLRYLTVIDKTAKMAGVDIHSVNESDNNIYRMLSNGGTSGVFQFESDGMTNVLMRLQPDSIEDLIATISLYRPGPMQSIPKYIENRHNPGRITYKHPLLCDILKVTYGCIVYQEQVMEICRRLADFSYGKADLVRRAMSKKKHDVMENERKAFIDGASKNGIDNKTANEIFDELAGFATYAFNKSHAAAYAYLAYQTAYLRFYHYKEYMTQLMTSVLDSKTKLLEYKADIEAHGYRLLPPDINKSDLEFTCESDGIRYGLLAVKNLGRAVIEKIIAERSRLPFSCLSDFCRRMSGVLNKRSVEALIKSGSLDSFPHNRRSMIMSYEKILGSLSAQRSRNIEGQLSLFQMEELGFEAAGELDETSAAPALLNENEIQNTGEFPQATLLQMEKESVGFFVSGHPIDKFAQHIDLNDYMPISAIIKKAQSPNESLKDGDRVKFMGMLIKKKQHVTKSNRLMCFSEFEDPGGTIEVIVFSDLYEKIAVSFTIDEIYAVYGTVSDSYEELKILADKIEASTNIQCQSYNTIFVNVDSNDKHLQARIYEIAKHFPGNDKIRICHSDTKEVKSINNINGIKITNNLVKNLSELCGKANIKLK